MPAFPTLDFASTGGPTSGPGGSSALAARSGPAGAFGFGFGAGAGAPGGDAASLVPRGIGRETARAPTAISGGREETKLSSLLGGPGGKSAWGGMTRRTATTKTRVAWTFSHRGGTGAP